MKINMVVIQQSSIFWHYHSPITGNMPPCINPQSKTKQFQFLLFWIDNRRVFDTSLLFLKNLQFLCKAFQCLKHPLQASSTFLLLSSEALFLYWPKRTSHSTHLPKNLPHFKLFLNQFYIEHLDSKGVNDSTKNSKYLALLNTHTPLIFQNNSIPNSR